MMDDCDCAEDWTCEEHRPLILRIPPCASCADLRARLALAEAVVRAYEVFVSRVGSWSPLTDAVRAYRAVVPKEGE